MAKAKEKKVVNRRTDEELEAALLAKIDAIRARKHAKDRRLIEVKTAEITKLTERINDLNRKHDRAVLEVQEAQARINGA